MGMPAMKRKVQSSYEDVLPRVVEALGTEGFGVLTEIDVKETLKKKIDVDFRRYKILGACNPKLAHEALGSDLDVGVLLPCNVLVYEEEGGGTTISAMDPVDAMGPFGSEALTELASEVRAKLRRALDQVS